MPIVLIDTSIFEKASHQMTFWTHCAERHCVHARDFAEISDQMWRAEHEECRISSSILLPCCWSSSAGNDCTGYCSDYVFRWVGMG